jgi:hypothetical protein
MKVFDLVCPDGHRFEGWFASAEQFAAQCDAASVRCPLCDSSEVHRAPSAPRLNFGSEPAAGASSEAVPDARVAAAAMLMRLRRAIAETDDVGARFAEEARRIHYAETAPRAIRGTTTERERRSLADEGIETLSIALPRALTETLQ